MRGERRHAVLAEVEGRDPLRVGAARRQGVLHQIVDARRPRRLDHVLVDVAEEHVGRAPLFVPVEAVVDRRDLAAVVHALVPEPIENEPRRAIDAVVDERLVVHVKADAVEASAQIVVDPPSHDGLRRPPRPWVGLEERVAHGRSPRLFRRRRRRRGAAAHDVGPPALLRPLVRLEIPEVPPRRRAVATRGLALEERDLVRVWADGERGRLVDFDDIDRGVHDHRIDEGGHVPPAPVGVGVRQRAPGRARVEPRRRAVLGAAADDVVASTEHEPIPILGGEVARAVVHDVHRVRGPGNDPVAPRALQERQQRRRIAQDEPLRRAAVPGLEPSRVLGEAGEVRHLPRHVEMIVVVPFGREGRVRRRRGGGEVLQEADGADVDAYEYVGGLRRQGLRDARLHVHRVPQNAVVVLVRDRLVPQPAVVVPVEHAVGLELIDVRVARVEEDPPLFAHDAPEDRLVLTGPAHARVDQIHVGDALLQIGDGRAPLPAPLGRVRDFDEGHGQLRRVQDQRRAGGAAVAQVVAHAVEFAVVEHAEPQRVAEREVRRGDPRERHVAEAGRRQEHERPLGGLRLVCDGAPERAAVAADAGLGLAYVRAGHAAPAARVPPARRRDQHAR